MTIRMVLGNQLVALPEKLGGLAVYGLADAPPKWALAITGGFAVGLCDAD